MKYFAYGTNLNLEIVEKKGLRLFNRQAAALDGYQLIFNKKAIRYHLPEEIGFANLQPHEGCTVEGGLYDISEDDIPRLDQTEKCPEHYRKLAVVVRMPNGNRLPAFTYLAQVDKTADHLIPSRNYINHILKAKEILSEAYCAKLAGLKTYNSECACCHRKSEILFLKEHHQMFMLCAACKESKTIWGDVRGKPFSVLDTEAVMQHIISSGKGYSSLRELLEAAVRLHLIKG